MQAQQSRKLINVWRRDEGKWKQTERLEYSTGKRKRVCLCLDIPSLFYQKFCLQTHWGLSYSFAQGRTKRGPGTETPVPPQWAALGCGLALWAAGQLSLTTFPPNTVYPTPLTPQWAWEGGLSGGPGSYLEVPDRWSWVGKPTVSLAGNAAWDAWMVLAGLISCALSNCGATAMARPAWLWFLLVSTNTVLRNVSSH